MNFQNMNTQNHPLGFLKGYITELGSVHDARSKHIIMLNTAEDILFHLVGICIGEYKTSLGENRNIEKKLFYYARKKKISFGDWQDLLRSFFTFCPTLNISTIFRYPLTKGEYLSWTFKKLKNEVINQGKDEGFEKCMSEMLKKRQQRKPIKIVEVFNTIIQMRNIQAHPLEQAKNPLRRWPLTTEYFSYINPLLDAALCELCTLWKDLEIGIYQFQYEDEMQYVFWNNKKNPIQIPSSTPLTIELQKQELYVLHHRKKVLPVMNKVPLPNREIQMSINREFNQERGRKVLREYIRKYLNKGTIDSHELFRLKDDADTHYLSENDVYIEIKKIQQELKIPGNVFAREVSKENPLHINPFWFVHLNTLSDYTVEKGSTSFQSSTGRQLLIWSDIKRFMDAFVQKYMTDDYYDWSHRPNRYQQGNLTGHYWSSMFPEKSPLESIFNIGLFLRKATYTKTPWMKKIAKSSQTQMFIWLNPDTKNLDRYPQKHKLISSFQRIVRELLIKHNSDIPGVNAKVLRWNLATGRMKVCDLHEIKSLQLLPDEILCPLSEFFQLEDVLENSQRVLDTLVYFAQFLKNIMYRLKDEAIEFG